MANKPKINLALVDEMPENPVRGTVYMSPDTSGNFVKVGVDGSVRTIFDGSNYVRKDESVWIPGYGENSAVLANGFSYATGDESVSHGNMTYARGLTSHAEGIGCFDYPISVYSDFSNNIIYGANNVTAAGIGSYIGLIVRYQGVYATIVNAYLDKKRGAVFVLDKPLLDDGSDFTEETEVYLLSGGVAAGECSHTEGDSTVAAGDYSHAEGFATYTGSTDSHAEGTGAITFGGGAHAEGDGTLATGDGSHAEGSSTTTSGHYSHAEGYSTRASGSGSHAEGEGRELSITINGPAGATQYTVTGGSLRDVKVGDTIRYKAFSSNNTLKPYEKENPDNGFTYAVITEVHSGKNNYIVVDGTLSFFLAITDGDAYILQGVAEGTGSHSEGYCTNAVGEYSHAEGNSTTALGDYSHVEGEHTTASGHGSHAEGEITTASGDYSHVEGNSTIASSYSSHAEGVNAKTFGDYSHAEGSGTRASGSCSHTEGENTTTFGYSSHAEGYSTIALGEYSHAEGISTEAFGNGSHAEGEGNHIPLDGVEVYGPQNTTVYTTSSAHGLSVNDILYIDYEIGEFDNKVAKVVSVDTSTQFTVDDTLNPDVSLDASLAGTYTFYRLLGCAYGNNSHVEGVDTIALVDYSHAEGNSTRTSNAYEHAQGSYNMSHNYSNTFGNSGNTLDSIGIGVSDASRSNAIEVMQNGDVYVKGVGSYDGSNYVNASTLQEVVNSGGGGSVDSMISITYANLKNLRDTSALVPGMQYRITDYQCTTTQPETQAASNLFDIIVTADSSMILNENARACHHAGDTYFANCKLEAWELKYCLDNDTSTYYWADTSNGKGIIYYMKDEWNNECPYDFKNIMFKRYAITAYTKTPSLVVDNSDNIYGFYYGAKEFWEEDGVVEFYNTIDATYDDNTYGYFYTFALKNLDNGNWYDFSVESSSELINTFGERTLCHNNCIKPVLYNNLLLNDNIIYSIFSSNNTYTNCCYINAQGCLFCTCGAGSYKWTCGCESYSWTCGNNCREWSCGNNSGYWTCGNNCNSWICGCESYSWTCGNNCNNWTCGNNCNDWSCGTSCDRWSCGNECIAWTCGNNCNSWVCENACSYWSCGDGCYSWICNSGSYSWACGSNMHYFQILNGVHGLSSDNKLQLNFIPNVFYAQIAGTNSNGALKIWAPADLID